MPPAVGLVISVGRMGEIVTRARYEFWVNEAVCFLLICKCRFFVSVISVAFVKNNLCFCKTDALCFGLFMLML